ncbi:hypothetical protein EG332_11960 [Pectobacterium versatile]|nr:hypothetical protein EG332_11960 [Pectobacterium versatile]
MNATSSDGRCAPYCLTSFFELLHSTIDSHHADIFVGFFLSLDPDLFRYPSSDVIKCLWHFIMVGYRATPSGPSQATL